MADGAFLAPAMVRRTFLIEAGHAPDLLLRVLAPFAVQGAALMAVELSQHGAGTSIRIEAGGLSLQRAQTLVERLRAMPSVTGVGLGWTASS